MAVAVASVRSQRPTNADGCVLSGDQKLGCRIVDVNATRTILNDDPHNLTGYYSG